MPGRGTPFRPDTNRLATVLGLALAVAMVGTVASPIVTAGVKKTQFNPNAGGAAGGCSGDACVDVWRYSTCTKDHCEGHFEGDHWSWLAIPGTAQLDYLDVTVDTCNFGIVSNGKTFCETEGPDVQWSNCITVTGTTKTMTGSKATAGGLFCNPLYEG